MPWRSALETRSFQKVSGHRPQLHKMSDDLSLNTAQDYAKTRQINKLCTIVQLLSEAVNRGNSHVFEGVLQVHRDALHCRTVKRLSNSFDQLHLQHGAVSVQAGIPEACSHHQRAALSIDNQDMKHEQDQTAIRTSQPQGPIPPSCTCPWGRCQKMEGTPQASRTQTLRTPTSPPACHDPGNDKDSHVSRSVLFNK